MKKLFFLYFLLIVGVVWFGVWYFVPREIKHTFNSVNQELPTTIVAVNSINSKISDDTLNNLKEIKKQRYNIVYATDTKLSKFEANKLKPYVNHVMADENSKNAWLKYQQALSWMMINVQNRKNIKFVVVNGETNELYVLKKNGLVSKKDFQTRVKRYAVFAGYNKDGIIEPYIITYLKGLEEVTDGIVYIADSSLKEGELEKLRDINIIYTQHQKHHKYDFGSYAIGYNWLKDNGYLDKADELIFANDSVYAPITSFKPMFEEMNKRTDLDFWGVTEGAQFTNHLVSSFMVYRHSVFSDTYFYDIWDLITDELKREDCILGYEIKITPYLEALGYKWDTYIDYEELEYLPYPAKDWYPMSLVSKHKYQFFKRRVFNDEGYSKEDIFELLDYLKHNHPKTYSDVISANHRLLQNLKNKDN